jgi:hypothetical protein
MNLVLQLLQSGPNEPTDFKWYIIMVLGTTIVGMAAYIVKLHGKQGELYEKFSAQIQSIYKEQIEELQQLLEDHHER